MAQIYQRGKSCTFRVSAGYGVNGKQIKRNLTWRPPSGMTTKQISTEKALQAALFQNAVKTGQFVDGSVTFKDFSDKWMSDYAEMQLEPKTVDSYKNLLKRINQAIGHIRMDRLQPTNLNSFYINLLEVDIIDQKYKPTERLLRHIKKSGKKGSQLARETGLSESTVYSIIHGRQVGVKSAIAVAKVLNVSLEDSFIPKNVESKLSGNTVLHYHRLISSILHTAVDWQVILANPASRVKSPRKNTQESKYLDDDEARKVVELLQNEPIQYRTMVTLLIYLGIRRGELCGLKWPDIDFTKKVIHIQRALQYLPDRGIFEKKPKNHSSIRALKMPEVAVQLLKEYKIWQNEERLQMGDLWQKNEREKAENVGDEWQDPELVFPRWNGSYINPDDITRWFSRFVKRQGLPPVNIHSLRHTNATLLIAAGTDIRTVSKRLGHAQTSTTTNIYAHAIRSADEAAAETIENIFEPKKSAIRVISQS